MKALILFLVFLVFTTFSYSQTTQTILGTWQSKDDASKVIEFYENKENQIFGREKSGSPIPKIILKNVVYDNVKKVYSGIMSPPDNHIKLNATISFVSKDELKIVVKKLLLKKTMYLQRSNNTN